MSSTPRRWTLWLVVLAGAAITMLALRDPRDTPPHHEARPDHAGVPILAAGSGNEARTDELARPVLRAAIVDLASGTAVVDATLHAGSLGIARSDALGHVALSIDRLPSAQTTVTISHAEFETEAVDVLAGETDLGRIALQRRLVFVGRVVDADGVGASQATVELAVRGSLFERIASIRANGLGQFRLPLPAGPAYLAATARRLVAWTQDGRWGTVVDPWPGQETTVTLQPTQGRLRVVAPNWPPDVTPVPLVLDVHTPTNGPPAREGFSRHFEMAVNQAELTLRLPRGEYEVDVRTTVHGVDIPQRTGYLYGDESVVQLKMFAIPPNQSWIVRVVDDRTGRPVPDAEVYEDWSELTDGAGMFTRTFWHGVPDPQQRLVVRHPQFEQAVRSVEAGESTVRLKRATPPVGTRILVRDAEGTARPDATLAMIDLWGGVSSTGPPDAIRSALSECTHLVLPPPDEETGLPSLEGWRQTHLGYRIDLPGHSSYEISIERAIHALESRGILDVQLAGSRDLSVRVLDERHNPVAGAEIVAWTSDVHGGASKQHSWEMAGGRALSDGSGKAVIQVTAARALVIHVEKQGMGRTIVRSAPGGQIEPIVLRRVVVEGSARLDGATAQHTLLTFLPLDVPTGLAYMLRTHCRVDPGGRFQIEVPHGVRFRVTAHATVLPRSYESVIDDFLPGPGQVLDLVLERTK